MTAIELQTPSEARTDPFSPPPSARVPRRPRLLSYVGRWGRARRWLPADTKRVLDVGCSFGYGSAALAAPGPDGRVVIGVERDPDHLSKARQQFPRITIIAADATELPVSNDCADAVVMLDVLEHIGEPRQAIAEAHRVLRPEGVLVLSVPHRGPLRWLDANNLYAAFRRWWPSLPPPDPATESGGHEHHHYAPAELQALLEPWFVVDRRARTGLGLQELVAIVVSLIQVGLRAPRVANALLPVHLFVYLVDDLIPSGPLAYHLSVRARPSATERPR